LALTVSGVVEACQPILLAANADRIRPCSFPVLAADRATARLRQLVQGAVRLDRVPCACPLGAEGMSGCNDGRFCGVLTVAGRDVGPILISASKWPVLGFVSGRF
jgi:hypothetical protein